MSAVQVIVTAEHIASGRRKNCERCPVARALSDVFPEASEIHVWGRNATVVVGDDIILGVKFPPETGHFVGAFDKGLPVSPFTFTAEVTA